MTSVCLLTRVCLHRHNNTLTTGTGSIARLTLIKPSPNIIFNLLGSGGPWGQVDFINGMSDIFCVILEYTNYLYDTSCETHKSTFTHSPDF